MTEVLPPAPSSAAAPTSKSPRPHSPPRRHRTSPPSSSEPQEKDKPASSRPQSMSFPAVHSSLPYALVRDFAYPAFHPMHYGTPPDPPSGTTTPGSEWNSSRRLSDPNESTGGWGTWKSDGLEISEALPSTSFGDDGEPSRKHRRSKSHADMSDWERGRRRSSGQRRSRGGGPEGDVFHFGSSQTLDPAGSESLRHSRAGNSRRDSHFAATLPSRTFHHSTGGGPQPRQRREGEDEDVIPLDAESSSHAHSPQRASMGPEDELFAGESLALYAFEPENPNELRLKEGQIILVSYRHGQGWLVAEDPTTGEQGLVPEEYVRLVREIEGWDSERGTFIDNDLGGDGEGMEVDEDHSTEVAEDSIMEDNTAETATSRDLASGHAEKTPANNFQSSGDAGEAMLTDSPPEIEMDLKAAILLQQQQNQRDVLKDCSGESRQDSAHADR